MNRLANLGILPNLSPVIKFVGGPWDGMYTRWSGVGLPEFIDTRNSKTPEAVPHVYQLWVFTDLKGITHTMYKHRGPNTQKN